jgi:hypothetical protein
MQAVEATEWDDVLDTGDIICVQEEIPVFVSLPELADLLDSTEDWDNPTREVPIRRRAPLESGVFCRAEPQASILDAAVLVTTLSKRHAALHARARSFETLGAMTDDPVVRAAWGTIAARFAELGRLLEALRALGEGGTVRGALELYVPSRPLAACLDSGYAYAERLLVAFGKLASQLCTTRPDWTAFQARVAEARSWLVPELFEEVRADLALMALQIGDAPASEVSRRLRHVALAVTDVDAMLAEWVGPARAEI